MSDRNDNADMMKLYWDVPHTTAILDSIMQRFVWEDNVNTRCEMLSEMAELVKGASHQSYGDAWKLAKTSSLKSIILALCTALENSTDFSRLQYFAVGLGFLLDYCMRHEPSSPIMHGLCLSSALLVEECGAHLFLVGQGTTIWCLCIRSPYLEVRRVVSWNIALVMSQNEKARRYFVHHHGLEALLELLSSKDPMTCAFSLGAMSWIAPRLPRESMMHFDAIVGLFMSTLKSFTDYNLLEFTAFGLVTLAHLLASFGEASIFRTVLGNEALMQLMISFISPSTHKLKHGSLAEIQANRLAALHAAVAILLALTNGLNAEAVSILRKKKVPKLLASRISASKSENISEDLLTQLQLLQFAITDQKEQKKQKLVSPIASNSPLRVGSLLSSLVVATPAQWKSPPYQFSATDASTLEKLTLKPTDIRLIPAEALRLPSVQVRITEDAPEWESDDDLAGEEEEIFPSSGAEEGEEDISLVIEPQSPRWELSPGLVADASIMSQQRSHGAAHKVELRRQAEARKREEANNDAETITFLQHEIEAKVEHERELQEKIRSLSQMKVSLVGEYESKLEQVSTESKFWEQQYQNEQKKVAAAQSETAAMKRHMATQLDRADDGIRAAQEEVNKVAQFKTLLKELQDELVASDKHSQSVEKKVKKANEKIAALQSEIESLKESAAERAAADETHSKSLGQEIRSYKMENSELRKRNKELVAQLAECNTALELSQRMALNAPAAMAPPKSATARSEKFVSPRSTDSTSTRPKTPGRSRIALSLPTRPNIDLVLVGESGGSRERESADQSGFGSYENWYK
jgi:hypothetical protein